PGPGDAELEADLEQRDQDSPARADQQPAARVHPEERAPEQEAPEREAHGAEEHAPEPDARRRHEPVEAGGQRAGRPPGRARSERAEVAGETGGAGARGGSGARGRHTSSPRRAGTACPASPTASRAGRTR